MYKVTLAIPVYNVEKYIERALLSALNQTFDSIEYLLIDDRGTDNSMNIAMDIIKDHPRGKDVRIIDHGVNIGLGAVRNTAIENAKGEFIYFMDSDDEITPECISILHGKMNEYFVDFVAASHNKISSNGEIIDQVVYEDYLVKKGEFEVARAYYMKNKMVFTHVWNKLYNLDFLKRNNIKCEHLTYEDLFFTYQVILNAQSCYLLSDVVYLYYEINSSIMAKTRKSFTSKIGKQFEEISKKKKEYLLNYSNCDFYPNLIKQTFLDGLVHIFLLYNSKMIPPKEKKIYVSHILAYPLSFKKMVALKSKANWIIYLISKIPIVWLKIYICKSGLKFLQLIRKIKNLYSHL
jgi:glycosyltransferase involved in cell wall biosynthesis